MLKKDENINTRLILAAILSTLLIFFWGKFFKQEVDPAVANRQKIEQKQFEKHEEVKEAEQVIDLNQKPREEVFLEEKKISIDTDKLGGSINLRGLKFDNLVLKDYKKTLDSDEKVQLLFPRDSNDAYFISLGWTSADNNIEFPGDGTLWKSDSEVVRVNSPVTLFYRNKDNVEFQVIITLDEDYMFNFEQKIINHSDKTFSFKINNDLIKRSSNSEARSAGVHEGMIGSFKKQVEEIKYKKLQKKEYKFIGFDWAGFTDKYWLVSLISEGDKSGLFVVDAAYNDGLYDVNFRGDSNVVSPNQIVSIGTKVFAGPKILDLLDKYSVEYNLPLFDRAVDFGWFYFLTKPIYIILKIFYNFVGNFGVAILLLTFLVKLIMYPFTKKSFISMAKMKKVQPKMEALKKKYGSDKMKLNKELVELYKKENISPLSGCLPMLAQIPVFFSLYKVLSISIDMRQAPFFGYIKNLAERDPTTLWNLFGLLPYDVNFFPIGFLPIFMSFTMWIQQRMSGQAGANQEAQMATKLMPICMFLLIFAGMPAGLLLYWTFSNIISILQQLFIEYKLNRNNNISRNVTRI